MTMNANGSGKVSTEQTVALTPDNPAEAMKESKVTEKKRRTRTERPFPNATLQAALELAEAIQEHAAGQDVRRLTLFEKLDKSPDSALGRQLVTNSSAYGITKGGYQSEFLSLTPEGKNASDTENTPAQRLKSRFTLGIEHVPAFKALYDKYKGSKLPSPEVIIDNLRALGVQEKYVVEGPNIFTGNLSFLNLLRTIGGAQRVITIEQALEELPLQDQMAAKSQPEMATVTIESGKAEPVDLGQTCFLISPIGEEGSEQRKHADMILNSFVEPALAPTRLHVVRADRITKPGMISSQVINFILCSKLVIVDLSFHNPNVFYEAAIRHMTGLPTVHLIRESDAIPFDLANFRTIKIDTSDMYTLVARLDTYKAQIANYANEALANPEDKGSNPIRAFCPTLKVEL